MYRVLLSGADGKAGSDPKPALVKPSIAVLPFANMSGDPEQEYFVDGLSEDILTELSRRRDLFVISRTSSFVYKGKSDQPARGGAEAQCPLSRGRQRAQSG